MTVAALGEAGHHTGWMRYSMTALAGRYRLVLVLMAGNAQYGFVLGIAAGKHLKRTLMAGGTHFVRCIRCHEHGCRHMRLMAFFALGGNHIRAVRFMALRTERDFAMDTVAETAGQIGMLALNLLQLDNLRGMAGQALIGDIVGQLDDFGGMRIVMAPQTTAQVVVGLAGMALATGRDNLFY